MTNRIIQLSREQIEFAIQLTRSFNPEPIANHQSAARDILLIALDQLKTVDSDFFAPFSPSTRFFAEYAAGFAALGVFALGTSAQTNVERQIVLALTFVYAYCLERTTNAQQFTPFDSRVLAYFEKYASYLDDEILARVKLMTLTVTNGKSMASHVATYSEFENQSNLLNGELASLASTIAGWKNELAGWSGRVDTLKQTLERNKDQLNFMGLTAGFNQLLVNKTKERRANFSVLVAIVCALIAVPMYGILHIETMTFEAKTLVRTIPFLALELLVLYFFRIVLRNYYSAKAQILQLELRRSLLGMIEEYANFRQRVSKDAKDVALDKFESLIFSGITADIDNIPSQFDGLEQLISLAKEFKK